MKTITSITKLDIFDLLRDGYEDGVFVSGDIPNVTYRYHGRLSEVEFLKRLYPLNEMPSNDERYEDAEEDIIEHTLSNYDWDEHWVFEDDRFGLMDGDDDVLLDFLCAVFHPEVRNEKNEWSGFLTKINSLLMVDGYELYESAKISQRSVYSWRPISKIEIVMGEFIPFSVRYEKEIENNTIKIPTIQKNIREKLVRIFNKYDDTFYTRDDTGYNHLTSNTQETLENISRSYTPSAFDESGNYTETDDFERFILKNYPYRVFDAIEFFSKMVSDKFTVEVNFLLNHNNYGYKLIDGRMEMERINLKIEQSIKEQGLKELIIDALAYYRSNSFKDRQNAVEKLWDAFERLKTHHEELGKKQSVNKITDSMSKGEPSFKELFETEFTTLTYIGNKFRIRHHENDRIDITDQRHYDYFFVRCFALIDAALSFLDS